MLRNSRHFFRDAIPPIRFTKRLLRGRPKTESVVIHNRPDLTIKSLSDEDDHSRKCQSLPSSCSPERESHEKLADVVTPLWKLPYDEQLELKWKKNRDVLLKLAAIVKKNLKSKSLCSLDEIVPSPITDYYRNKDEFHVRYDSDGRVVCGLFIGQAKNQNLECIRPDRLLNIKKEHVEAARVFGDYVAKSRWKICEHFQRGGNWRQLTVRSNEQGDLMATALIHPQNLIPEEIEDEMGNFSNHFVRHMSKVTSLYYQACPHTRCNSEQAPFQLLHGEPHIYETIDQFRFRLSPESFFQVNTRAAGVLYDLARKLLKPSKMTTMLDICCGIGTQGLIISKQVRGVVGIEISAKAVQDAQFNASANGVHNSEFYAGPVEKILAPVLRHLERCPDLAAILNPSRSGVHTKVICQLRENERIRRLVYVSCQPESALMNFAHLIRPAQGKLKGEPFRLVRAVPVDLFPHTEHCELVLLFQR